MWRFALMATGVVFVLGCIGAFVFWAVASNMGWLHAPDFDPPFPSSRPRVFGPLTGIGWLIGFIFFISLVTRLVRRIALPLGDLINAAARVEDGDYTARITERGPREVRKLARAFNSMTTQLQANEEQRRAMLADVTHELRTPLSVIQGNVEGLMDGVYARDDAHLQVILDETKVMARLIEDLRTLSLAESGRLTLQRESTDVAALIHDVANSFRAQVERAGISLAYDAPTTLPPIEVDSVRIREVLANLISNAQRYTPQGGRIQISAALVSPTSIEVRVSDTGRGISPELLPHVFDRFHKSRDSMGSGLGLAIARQLIELHGGQIYAESAQGAGTTIRFTLPVA